MLSDENSVAQQSSNQWDVVVSLLRELEQKLIDTRSIGRLLLTGDVRNAAAFKAIAALAEKSSGGKQGKDPFFYGVAVCDEVQAILDKLTRNHWELLLDEWLPAQFNPEYYAKDSGVLPDCVLFQIKLLPGDHEPFGFFISRKWRSEAPKHGKGQPAGRNTPPAPGPRDIAPTATPAVPAMPIKKKPKPQLGAKPLVIPDTPQPKKPRKKEPPKPRKKFRKFTSVTNL